MGGPVKARATLLGKTEGRKGRDETQDGPASRSMAGEPWSSSTKRARLVHQVSTFDQKPSSFLRTGRLPE